MKLEKYLTENNPKSKESRDLELIKYFKSETTQWFKEMGQQRVWRSTNRKINDLQKVSARKDRKPKDTPKEIHVWFDDWFKTKFGWKARRRYEKGREAITSRQITFSCSRT